MWWLAWWILTHGLLLATLLYAKWESPRDMRDIVWMLHPVVWLISGASAVVLGGAHFAIWKSGLWRRRATKLAVILLALVIAAALLQLAGLGRKHSYQGAGLLVYRQDEYERLARSGRYDLMVTRMEEDCAYFNKAKKKLGGKLAVHSCNHGYSHLFVTMAPAWDSVIRLAPYPVLATLECARYDGHHEPDHLGGYGEWRPLAKRVSESDTPILKTLGAYMLDDMAGFAAAAYPLADEDPDALVLAAFAALKDPVPSRAIERMLQYQSMAAYQTFPYCVGAEVKDSHDVAGAVVSKLKSSTIQGLDEGSLDETLKARLREQPWAPTLPGDYRRQLGLTDPEPEP